MDIDGGSQTDQTNEVASAINDSSESNEGEQQIGFADMDLSRDMRRSLERAGYEEPSPVQAGVIPPALDGYDVMG
ncbi:MAG: DEAD/DEAH box helicase, partial [Planctomycetaceae bacterium]|nr:DEAD/DEAH box helicase [Planctomycetaceae bacterium]